ncbi:unnamed protein product [Polarella glacialis]|uniref:Uncharacterized protein n=1 Tax=Polarella glacialis TaxID=89957 RepID=A0A813IFQ1_POLGL|nr:unnamed protein product [Polarella glacialis]
MANLQVIHKHEEGDTHDEWVRLSAPQEHEELHPPPHSIMSAMYNYMKNKPDRNPENDISTLLNYAQGDSTLQGQAIRDKGQGQTYIVLVYLDAFADFEAYLSIHPG